MNITLLEWAWDADLTDEEALLRRYTTTTGWCEALQALAARDGDEARVGRVTRVSAVLRFHRDAVLERRGVVYHFCRDAGGARPSTFLSPARLAAVVAGLEPDVVHVNGLGYPVQTWRLRQRITARTALVVQDHASGAPVAPASAGDQVKRLIRRRVMRAADAFLFTAREQARPWQDAGLIEAGQAVDSVIEASTAMQPVPMDQARRVTGVHGQPAILWVGRLNANKDPLCVIEAFARLRVTRPQATLTMIYSGDELLPEVRRRVARDPRLRGGVSLLGQVPRDQMARYYSAADLFVIGSHQEGSGYAVLEACACGVPPAVTDIPPFRRLTRDGAVGRLWTPGDPHACAVALIALMRVAGPIVRSNVRAHFQRTLSWPAIARDAQAVYARACEVRQQRLQGGTA